MVSLRPPMAKLNLSMSKNLNHLETKFQILGFIRLRILVGGAFFDNETGQSR